VNDKSQRKGSGDLILRHYANTGLGGLKNHKKPQSGQPVSGPGFKTGTSRIRTRSANNHSTTTFGSVCVSVMCERVSEMHV
jgi:hypothetical protein